MIERRLSYLKIDTHGYVHVKVPKGIMTAIETKCSGRMFRESFNEKYKKDHKECAKRDDMDSIAWFLYVITILPQNKKKYSEMSMIPLSAEILKTWLTSRYSKYIKFLETSGFLQVDHNYVIGKRCKLYNIKFDSNQLENYIIKDRKLCRRLYTEFIRKREEINTELKSKIGQVEYDALKVKKEYFDKIMKCIKIDKDKALSIVESSGQNDIAKHIEKTRICDIADGITFSSFDKNGRFHTNFTQISKSVRNECLTLNDEKLSEIDIVSCQPQMLNLLMQDLSKEVEDVINNEGNLSADELGDYTPSDCRLNYIAPNNKIDFSILVSENNKIKFDKYNHYGYNNLSEFKTQLDKDIRLMGNILNQNSGTDIYKIFCKAFEQKGHMVTRDSMKKMFMSFLFSDEEKHKGFDVIKSIWQKQFPAMYSVIKYDKLGDHTSIANKLQHKESEFIYGVLMSEFQKNNIDFFTVHDCVFVQQSKSEHAYEIFKTCAENFGLTSGITLKKMN